MELYKTVFKSILSTDQSPKGQSVINIQQNGQITIKDLKILICVSNNFLSVINMNQNFNIQMEQLYLSDNKSPMQSIFLFNYLIKLVIKDSIFVKNKSFQNGGVIQIYEVLQFQVVNCTFDSNQSTNGNGGTISYYNSNSIGLLNITQSMFVQNSALQERGGAIAMNYVDLQLQEVQMTKNKAVIGGAIYYQTLIPTIFLYKNYTELNNNISNNIAYLYGNNIGSILRKIDVTRMVANYDYNYFYQENQQIILIDQFQSGSLLELSNINILDEEGNPFQYPKNIKFSSDIHSFLSFVQIVVQTNETQIQILGSKYSQFQDQIGFNFNLNLAYFFNKSDSFVLSTSSTLSLLDINGNNIINPGDYQIVFKIYFRSCLLGEVQKNQYNFQVCEECSEGKYALSLQDQICSICPYSAMKCQGSSILLKNGYWRKNNLTDIIVACDQSFDTCQPQDQKSKFGCKKGYVGPLCEQCDQDGSIWGDQYFSTFQKNSCMKCNQNLFIFLLNSLICFGIISIYINYCIKKIIIQIEKQLTCHYLKLLDLIYLSNSARTDNSQSYSKIMIDHLQIVSIIGVQFQRILPISYIALSAGNPLEIYVNSITCFLPNSLQQYAPLWFQKVLWSFSLPLYTIIMFKIYNSIRHFIKKEKINQRYNITALIFIFNYYYTSLVLMLTKSIDCRRIGDEVYSFIDLNILCWNYDNHFKYILSFILPALLIISFVIPLLFLLKMRQALIKKTLKTQMSQYFFLIGEYKYQFYYWELTKFFYKTLVIIALILLQDQLVIKACIVNSIMIFYLVVNIRIKPYDLQIFNELHYQSIIICLYTLNFSILYSQFVQNNYQFSWVVSIIAFILNLYFFFKLLFQQYFKILPQQEANRNIFQKIVYYLKQKFPNCFSSIKMSNLIKLGTALKIKLIKKNIKTLSQFSKYTQQEQSFKMTGYFSQNKNSSSANQQYEHGETYKSQEQQQLALQSKMIYDSNQTNLLEFRQQLKSSENLNSNIYSPQLKHNSSLITRVSSVKKEIKESYILEEDYSIDSHANQISQTNQIIKNPFVLSLKKCKQHKQQNITTNSEKSIY
ncbi:transmembrane protein, putative (macronuclear) [Tetrahymena thermophila SB210]|uniref:Transmembrane protein, putative n=1 Tax=Tetrahymena thermophila (strain SB210) TaxID=312017 RepID=Q22NE5_TETTS|nr:transmembrane protein, putative [Tetrahymena thermophila SB210]EAR86840.3 transmembrane protein, putative [Tetrahymena thermophila SB210]|eukprot:XP_001007085.3 transmembrane protein, putative [Tetrahymena thermophila SB210]